MALVKSLGVGKGVKSAGNLTYRVVRGRTIASEKVGSTAAIREAAYSNNGKLNKRCALFLLINSFIGAHRVAINASFNKSKYGSAGNFFYKLNRVPLEAALSDLAEAGGEATMPEIEAAIADYAEEHPNVIYRQRKSGLEDIFLNGEWEDDLTD